MIYLFLADGFEEVEAICPLDILRRAGLEVRTLAVHPDTPRRGTPATHADLAVTGAHGLSVLADMAARDFDDPHPDMVILPGGMPGTRYLDQSPDVDRALSAASASGAWIAAICAAPSVLGHRGLLNGLRATCFPGFERELHGASEIGGRVIRDGHIITAIGMGAAHEFAFELVSVLTSPAVAGTIRSEVQAL